MALINPAALIKLDKMKKTIILAIALLLPMAAMAQTIEEETHTTDSLVYRLAPAVDSSLVGKSIFNILTANDGSWGEVKIHQSYAIVNAMKQHIETNSSRTLTGYRVRIFFDNSQTARNDSESVMKSFMAAHPGIPAYRNYQNPFFRVVVGDFRTKSEAMEFFQSVKSAYPSALLIKENINFPIADKEHSYIVDTVTVANPIIAL